MSFPTQSPAILTLDGRYAVGEALASTERSCLTRGRHSVTGAGVAIKIFLGPQAVERSRREQAALFGPTHPHLAHMLGVGPLRDGRPALVLALWDGPDLSRRLQVERRLDASRALAVTRQLLTALQTLHDRGYVHCDVKPENILFAGVRGSAADHVILSDLDAAQRPGDLAPVMATPPYAAPELRRGEPPSAASDLFAAGAVLYEMLSGRPPDTAPRPLSRVFPADASLATFVDRLLAVAPEDRFATAHAARQALDAIELNSRLLGVWAASAEASGNRLTVEMVGHDGEPPPLHSAEDVEANRELAIRGGGTPVVWVLTGDPKVENSAVLDGLGALEPDVRLELIGENERLALAAAFPLEEMELPWLIVLTPSQLRAEGSFPRLVASRSSEVGVVLVASEPTLADLALACGAFEVETCVPTDAGQVEQRVRQALGRARARRVHHDSLRIGVRDAEEELSRARMGS